MGDLTHTGDDRLQAYLPWHRQSPHWLWEEYTIVCLARVCAHFFSRPTYRFIRYTLNHLKLDQLVGVKLHGPLGVAFGWFGASQGDQPGFTVTIEFSRHGRMLALFALQSGFQVSQDKRFTSPLDGRRFAGGNQAIEIVTFLREQAHFIAFGWQKTSVPPRVNFRPVPRITQWPLCINLSVVEH